MNGKGERVMIYFDNAATGGFKPRIVTDTATTVMRFLCANPGRSGHRLSVASEKIVFSCRELLGETFNAQPDRVIFTKNCTEALNVAIFGTAKRGGRIITTVFEHNSVLRPLHYLEEQGIITLDVVSPENDKSILQSVAEKITDETYLIVMTAVSNVTGESMPIREVGLLAKRKNLLFLVDGAQGGGHIPLDMESDNISMLCLPAHKGLYGVMGCGALIIDRKTEISPLTYGGTGSESFNLNQPLSYPERLEAGTLPLPAIAGFGEGVKYVSRNVENFGDTLFDYTKKLIEELKNVNGINCYSFPNRSGIVAFEFTDTPSSVASDIYNARYDVAVRGGLHCAPLTHKRLGTQENGLVRVSFAVQNTYREIAFFLKVTSEMANKQNPYS